MFDRNWLLCFVHFSTSIWITFLNTSPKEKPGYLYQGCHSFRNLFLGFLGDFRSFFDESLRLLKRLHLLKYSFP